MPNSLSNKSMLVTGGAGFIGSHVCKSLVEKHDTNNIDITVLDNLSAGTPDRLPDAVRLLEGDVRDPAVVEEAVTAADIVFHLAGLVSVDRSVETPPASHSTNATGTLNVLEAARGTNTRVVFASSAAIYGYPESTPIAETHPLAPTSPYGLDKLTADHYTRLYSDLYDLETIALRYFNVYGPGQTGGDYAGVITVFIDQALAGEPITIHGEGSQTRDFVFVNDVVRANFQAATITDESALGGAYNIATGESITIRELAEHIQDITDTGSDIVHIDPRDGDIDKSRADIGKAKMHLDYEPETSLEDGLERTIEWYRNN